MQVDITKIEDAWLADIIANLKNSLGLKTIETFEGNFDEQSLRSSIIRAPYALIQCTHDGSDEKNQAEKTTKGSQVFSIVVGAESLRDKRERQKGIYAIAAALKSRYDGMTLMVPETDFVQLSWITTDFLLSVPGLLVYQLIFHIPNN